MRSTGEAYTQRNKNGGKYRKKRRGGRRGGEREGEMEEMRIKRDWVRGGENDPKTQWSSMPPRKIGLRSPLTISKLRATLPTYPA